MPSEKYLQRIDRFVRAVDVIADLLAPEGRPDAPDVSVRELQALRILHWAHRMRMSDLASAMRVPVSTATRVVDRLIARRLVERHVDPGADRRAVHVQFSRYGLQVGRIVMDWRRATADQMLRKLPAREQQALVAVLDRLLAPAEARTR